MTIIVIMFFIAFVIGMPVAFWDEDKFEDYSFVEKFVGPFEVPEEMVFFTESSDMDFWPDTNLDNTYVVGSIHLALIEFWRTPSKELVVAPEREYFPKSAPFPPNLSWRSPWGVNAYELLALAFVLVNENTDTCDHLLQA